MQISRVTIENFRTLDAFILDLNGESCYLVGENAIGKSSLIAAIVRALGRDRAFERADFLDLKHPVDIRVTLTGLDATQLGILADAVDFGAVTPNLTYVPTQGSENTSQTLQRSCLRDSTKARR
jgi:predicted ATP-dependent endonuclease of OLD family